MLPVLNLLRIFVTLFISSYSYFGYADSFIYNTYNNHGMTGLINNPSARILEESSHGITLYDGNPDQKMTFTASPFDWLEASFFYSNITSLPYGSGIDQTYKDKGFNVKFKLKDEGFFPAVAIGFNDIAGTDFYSSEYIVGNYGIENIDFSFGLAWGTMNGSNLKFKNPFGYLHNNFNSRPVWQGNTSDKGGSINFSKFFSGDTVSPFFGISYAINQKYLIRFEHDTKVTPGKALWEEPSAPFSFGVDYFHNENFNIGIYFERGNYISAKFVYKNKSFQKINSTYNKRKKNINEDKYQSLIKNLESNGIGVNKITKKDSIINLELTQFIHPNIQKIENIISQATTDADIESDIIIKKQMRVADMIAFSEYEEKNDEEYNLIFERDKKSNLNSNTRITFRPFIASREEFFKGALLLENDIEFILKDNFFFSSNIKYSLYDNFSDLRIQPLDQYPAQVRSDIKDYLKSLDQGVIGRMQFDYHYSFNKNNHIMITTGILEDMFMGSGFEYLYFDNRKNYAIGFEIFDVYKRDYKMRFGRLGYQNVVNSVNFYHRNYGSIPFDTKISYGEYLAGDEGITFELSRSFPNGTKFGIFASFTDVSAEQYGEGSFDKGIFFNIPIYGSFIDYTWKPLTKDPGAKLSRKNTLYDLLVKFRPIN